MHMSVLTTCVHCAFGVPGACLHRHLEEGVLELELEMIGAPWERYYEHGKWGAGDVVLKTG